MRVLFIPTNALTIIALYILGYPILVHSSTSSLELPSCADLRDSTEKFTVETLTKPKDCAWIGRTDTIWRCFMYKEAVENCPKTCQVKCQSDKPSLSPSMSISTDVPFCEDLEDTNTSRFYVEGTNGTGMKSCRWAKRRNTFYRCKKESVRKNCEVICNTPCMNRSDSPTLSPTSDKVGAVGLNEDIQVDNRSSRRQRIIIGCGVAGALCAIGFALYFLKSSHTRNAAVTYDLNEDSYSEDNEQLTLGSLASNDDKVASIQGDQPLPIAKTCSYIPADQKNLGAHHALHDVQCCGNFPCENCRMENNLTFVRVSKWDTFRRSRSWFNGGGKRNRDSGNVILPDLNSVTSSNASSV